VFRNLRFPEHVFVDPSNKVRSLCAERSPVTPSSLINLTLSFQRGPTDRALVGLSSYAAPFDPVQLNQIQRKGDHPLELGFSAGHNIIFKLIIIDPSSDRAAPLGV
jgi:hypothetical protein